MLAGLAGFARAASFDERVEALFRPLLAERIALSPDGQRVAYTALAGDGLSLVIVSVEHPAPRRTIKVEAESDAKTTPARAPAAGHAPRQLRFLRWATPTRLVFAPTERVVPLPPVVDQQGRTLPNPDGPTVLSPILVADADGRQRGTLVDAHQFQETPDAARRTLADFLRTPKELAKAHNEPVRWRMPHLDILGFLPREPEQLILQTRGAYSMPAQHLVDIRTGSVREFGGEWPAPPGEPQIFDWHRLKVVGERQDAAHPATSWRDVELDRVQRELEAKFPRRIVELLDWTDTRARVLFRVTGGSDAGRVFVYQRTENLAVEILRHAPWLNAAKLHETRFFECAARDGARLSGYVTWPTTPRVAPPPLLVVFPSGFPGGGQPAFDPEAQVFADLGFVVARLNHRCVAGVKPADLATLRAAVDRVSIEDAHAAIEWLAARHAERPFDRKRVVTLGRGFGGYLAVRALQVAPTAFRCGIALDAPMELRPHQPGAPTRRDIPDALLAQEGVDWKKLSVVEQAEALINPVLLLTEPKRSAAIDGAAGELRARLQQLGRTCEHGELDAGFVAARPQSRAAVYRRIDEFLHANLQGYAVKIGTAKEVE